MSVKYAIVGMLRKYPSHPYRLIKLFEEHVGASWELNRGQVYQALGAMERDGLVEATESVNGHGVQMVYRVTAEGERLYQNWMRRRTERLRPLRDEIFIKLSFADGASPTDVLDALARKERLCSERLAEYVERYELMGASAAQRWELTAQRLLMKASMAHLEAELLLLTEARTCVESQLGRIPQAA